MSMFVSEEFLKPELRFSSMFMSAEKEEELDDERVLTVWCDVVFGSSALAADVEMLLFLAEVLVVGEVGDAFRFEGSVVDFFPDAAAFAMLEYAGRRSRKEILGAKGIGWGTTWVYSRWVYYGRAEVTKRTYPDPWY